MHILRAEGVTKVYRGRRVVDSVSLQLKQGEIVGLLGPNGAGKTTIFHMITGLVAVDGGEVHFDHTAITKMHVYQRARLGLAFLPQESSVFRGLSVEENLLAILETMHLSRHQRRQRLRELLSELNLAPVAKLKASRLSGGERRRVEVGRALALNPAFLLLDEPFSEIDPITVEEIQRMVRRLKAKTIGVLITDHNARETLAITDRAYVIYDGRILVEGTPLEIAEQRLARERFFGEGFRIRGESTHLETS